MSTYRSRKPIPPIPAELKGRQRGESRRLRQALVRELYDLGHTPSALARAFEVSQPTIHSDLSKTPAGKEPVVLRGKQPAYSAADRADIVHRHNRHVPLEEIARDYGITAETLSAQLYRWRKKDSSIRRGRSSGRPRKLKARDVEVPFELRGSMMGHPPHLVVQRNRLAKELARGGLNPHELAELFCLVPDHIAAVLSTTNDGTPPFKYRKYRKYSEGQRKKIIQLWIDGHPLEVIAERFRTTEDALRRRLDVWRSAGYAIPIEQEHRQEGLNTPRRDSQ